MLLALIPLLVTVGCNNSDDISYAQFNCDEDQTTIEVGAAELLDPVTVVLRSTSCGEVAPDTATETDAVVIGQAEVRPGGGPIGTEHEIVVVVDDEYQDLVDRVSVRTDSGSRGVDEYDLNPDSADEGYYKLTLVTVGEEGETRSDILTFRLWDAEQHDTQN